MCKFSSKSIKRYRRSCAYEVHMSNVKKLNFKFDYLPLEEPGKKFLPSCTSTYYAQPLCKVSSKSVKRFRRSCAYGKSLADAQTDGQTVDFKYPHALLAVVALCNLHRTPWQSTAIIQQWKDGILNQNQETIVQIAIYRQKFNIDKSAYIMNFTNYRELIAKRVPG